MATRLLIHPFHDYLAALDHKGRVVDSKIVGDLSVVGAVEEDYVGLFPSLDRTNVRPAIQTVRRVDGGSGDRLGGSHSPLRACERENHRHR